MAGKTGKKKGNMGGLTWAFLLAAVLAVACGCGKEAKLTESLESGVEGLQNSPSNPQEDEKPAEPMTEGDGEEHSGRETERETEGRTETERAAVAAATDFGLRLLRLCMEDSAASLEEPGRTEGQQETGNRVVSPLSVLSALAMTGNGAEGETLEQMEETFGLTVPELSAYLSRRGAGEAAGNEKCRLSMVNGIWFTEDDTFTVEQDFTLSPKKVPCSIN